MKRRDLNVGDVFVYVNLPIDYDPDGDEVGKVRYVVGDCGDKPWFEGAEPSPNWGNGQLDKEVLDSDVVLLQKPEGRIEKRAEIRDAVSEAIEVLEQLRDSV